MAVAVLAAGLWACPGTWRAAQAQGARTASALVSRADRLRTDGDTPVRDAGALVEESTTTLKCPTTGQNKAATDLGDRQKIAPVRPTITLAATDGVWTRTVADESANDERSVGFNVANADQITWKILGADGKAMMSAKDGKPVEGTVECKGKGSAYATLPRGALRPGNYTIEATATNGETTKSVPARGPVHVMHRGVAFVVGVDRYAAQGRLWHAADDAVSMRTLLLERGYSERNIVHVIVRAQAGADDPGTIETDIGGQPDRIAAGSLKKVRAAVNAAYERFKDIAMDAKAIHAIVFFAGHGQTNETTKQHDSLWPDGTTSPSADWVVGLEEFMAANRSGAAVPPLVVSIFDAYRNGAAKYEVKPEFKGTEAKLQALNSCLPGQRSYETGSSQTLKYNDPPVADGTPVANGLFTFALVHAFRTCGPDATLETAWAKAAEVLKKLVADAKASGIIQAGQDQSLRDPSDLAYRYRKPIHAAAPTKP
jgi:hypothetical protein